ncbi:MAG: methyltransferase domain-containing protein [Thermodesulfobacteriota bacterium]
MESTINGVQLTCPYCDAHPPVEYILEHRLFICPVCKRQYNEWDGKPCFLDKKSVSVWAEPYEKFKKKRWKTLEKLYLILKAPRIKSKRRFSHLSLLHSLAQNNSFYKALYIGYNQPFEDKYRKNIIELEVVPKEHVDVVSQGEYIPFPNNSFDLIVISGVIEHTSYPFKVIEESYRILKKGGMLYVSSPWVYPYHGGDNYRFSEEGLRILCNQFGIIEIGSLDGPLHALGIFLIHYVSNSLSFGNKYLRYILAVPINWILLPLFIIDIFVNRQKKSSYVLDANIYAVAIK